MGTVVTSLRKLSANILVHEGALCTRLTQKKWKVGPFLKPIVTFVTKMIKKVYYILCMLKWPNKSELFESIQGSTFWLLCFFLFSLFQMSSRKRESRLFSVHFNIYAMISDKGLSIVHHEKERESLYNRKLMNQN